MIIKKKIKIKNDQSSFVPVTLFRPVVSPASIAPVDVVIILSLYYYIGRRRDGFRKQEVRGRPRPVAALTGPDQQAGPGREPMTDRGRRLRVRRERRHADGHGAAGRRPGRHRRIGGTMARVQLLSVRVVVAV